MQLFFTLFERRLVAAWAGEQGIDIGHAGIMH